MEGKHTPGPWWFSEMSNDIFADPMGMLKLAKVNPINEKDDGSANGKLIAAAPDLLETLKLIVETAHKDYPDAPWIPNAIWKDIEGKINLAIKRAEKA